MHHGVTVGNSRALASGATADGAVVVVTAALLCKKCNRWETAQAGQYFVITHGKTPRLEGGGGIVVVACSPTA